MQVSVTHGPDEGHAFQLEAGDPITIGRGDAGVRLKDGDVSQPHALLFRRKGRWWLVDLRSTNGTFINGRRATEPLQLTDRDQIQLGRSTLICQFAERGRPSRLGHAGPLSVTDHPHRSAGLPAVAAPGVGQTVVEPAAEANVAPDALVPAVDAPPAAEPGGGEYDYLAWEDRQRQFIRSKRIARLLTALVALLVLSPAIWWYTVGHGRRGGDGSTAQAAVAPITPRPAPGTDALRPETNDQAKSSDRRTAGVLAAMRRRLESKADRPQERAVPQE